MKDEQNSSFFFIYNMQNDKQKDAEYVGYSQLIAICQKIGKAIGRVASLFIKQADKLRFEQYKYIFGEYDSDIYITTYPKSGTTMMQVILYQLTTKGDMSFDHIYDVSPWIRNASFTRQEPVELPHPRIIKTHDRYKEFDKGLKGRFIHVHRNGQDVAVSLYNQTKDYNNNNLTFEKFLADFLKTKAWFNYSKAWFQNKNKYNILHVRYEDLLTDKRKEIMRIVEFLGLKVEEETIERTLHYSSFEYMKEHETKFGEQPKEKPKHTMRYDNFIRKGVSGEGEKEFTPEQKKAFEKCYEELVKPFEK